MKQELIMDISKEIFKLDKDALNFEINASNIEKLSSLSSHSTNQRPLSETEVTATNLTSDYIIVRVKTTKKGNYAINPTYTKIIPKGNQTFKITYYDKPGNKPNSKEHKFRIEGFIIPEDKKNDPEKELFQDYIKSGIKVQGNSIKLTAKFIQEENITENNNNDNNNKLEEIKEDEKEILRQSAISSASAYSVPEQKSSLEENNSVKLSDLIINNNKINVELSDKEKLENLKNEYNQLKEEVDNLRSNEEALNKKIRNEKNKKNIAPQSEYYKYNVPEIKEKQFSRNMLIGIFAFSVLLGFYLIK